MVKKIIVLLLLLPVLSCVKDSDYPDITIYETDSIVTLFENDILTAGGVSVIDPIILAELTAYNPYDNLDAGKAITDSYKYTDLLMYDDSVTFCTGVALLDMQDITDGHIFLVNGSSGNRSAAEDIFSYELLRYAYLDIEGAVIPYEYVYVTGAIGKEIKLPLVAFVLLTENPDFESEDADEDTNTTDKYLVELQGVFCNEFSPTFPADITDGQYLITYGYTLTLKKK